MKKTLFIVAAALFAAVSASAQGQYPTEYVSSITNLSEGLGRFINENYCGVWDEIVQGKPGQGLGLVASGAKTVKTHYDFGYFSSSEDIHEFYPNGLLKAKKSGEDSFAFNYDKQWRLKNVVKNNNNKVVRTYEYDTNGKLTKLTYYYDGGHSNEFVYKYDASGNLMQINKDDVLAIDIKGNNIVKSEHKYYATPAIFKYDAQNRWIGSTYVSEFDEGDFPIYVKDEVKFTYPKSPFPTSMGVTTGCVNDETYAYEDKPETRTYQCMYAFDDHQNWTTWKATGTEPWTITRTISYYTDEEVKQALAEMEAARKAPSQKKEEKKEDLWEF